MERREGCIESSRGGGEKGREVKENGGGKRRVVERS